MARAAVVVAIVLVPALARATDAPVSAVRCFDGWTGRPVAARAVPADPRPGEPIRVVAPGYLVREQPFDGSPVFLWPAREVDVAQLVYGWELGGPARLVRWTGPFRITLDGRLGGDPLVRAELRDVLDEIDRVSGLKLSIGEGGACRLRLGEVPQGALAVASLHVRDSRIVRAEVAFRSRSELLGGSTGLRNTLLHELGHVLGLGHSADVRDVMAADIGPGSRRRRFRAQEAAALRLMYGHRQPGNLAADRAPAVEHGDASAIEVAVSTGTGR